MRRFLLYVHTGRAEALHAMLTVLTEMDRRGVRGVVTDEQVAEIRSADPAIVPPELLEVLDGDRVDIDDRVTAADRVELGIVLGGDGTILRALEVVRDAKIPVHGVNLGHVGFLAESEVAELSETVVRLIEGAYEIEERSTLDVLVFDAEQNELGRHWALNEASLEKADRQKMINVVIEIDDRPVSSFGCDGVAVDLHGLDRLRLQRRRPRRLARGRRLPGRPARGPRPVRAPAGPGPLLARRRRGRARQLRRRRADPRRPPHRAHRARHAA